MNLDMNLDNIKIYIIENEKDVANNIQEALCQLKNENGSKFNKNNITIKHIIINNASADDIFKDIKSKVMKYDVLFIDLHLGSSVEQGSQLIRQFMSDALTCNIPKYIISSEMDNQTLDAYTDIYHYARPIEKPSANTVDNYKVLFENEKMAIALPRVVAIYRATKLNRKIDDIAFMIQEMKTTNSFDHTEIKSALDVINKLLKSVDVKIMDLHTKTAFINQATLTMLKLLPDAIPQNKAQKAKKFIEDNMSEWIDDIGEDFFPNNKQNFIKSFLNAIKGTGEDALKDDANSALRQIIQQVAHEQGIEGENLAFLSVQLTYKGIASLYSLVTLKA